MIKKIFFLNFTSFYFLFILVFSSLIYSISIDANASIVWVVISTLFYPLLVMSFYSKHKTLQFFLFALFLAHGIGSPLFFLEKEIYTKTGFSAVREFNFTISWYLYIYMYVFIFFYFTLFFTILLKYFLPTNYFFNKEQKVVKKNKSKYFSVYLILIILLFSLLNFWMFNNGIGLTGIQPPRLPFKLTGFLYFFSRFFAPIIILYLYSKSSRNYLLTALILTYALWAAITTVSRTTLTMYWLPVLFYSILDKKYILLSSAIVLFFIVFPFIDNARNYVYQINDGVVSMNANNGLFSIAEELIKSKDIISIKDAIFGFVGRLGGTQDVVLADQYDNRDFGNTYSEFFRVFFISNLIDVKKVQEELYGFAPPEGFSPGDGAITASVLMITNKSLIALIFVSIYVSILLHINEILLTLISKIFNYSELIFFLALLFNMILVPKLSMLWLYCFLLILLFIYLIFKYTFIKKLIPTKFNNI